MNEREKLIELLKKAPYGANAITLSDKHKDSILGEIADYLLENGVVVLPCRKGYQCTIRKITFDMNGNSEAELENAIFEGIACITSSDSGRQIMDVENVFSSYEEAKQKPIPKELYNAYVNVPDTLTEKTVINEYGIDAFRYYNQRLQERRRQGRMYNNSLKTIYIWAAQDRKTHQGFYSTYRGTNRSKHKNHGGS